MFDSLPTLSLNCIYRKNHKKNSANKKVYFQNTFKFSIFVILGSIGYDLMFNIDTLFIRHLMDLESVGLYGASRTLGQIFTFLPMALQQIIMMKWRP